MYKKSIKMLIFMLAMLIVFSACNNGGTDETTEQGQTEATTESASEAPEPTNEYGDIAVKSFDGVYTFLPSLWLAYPINGNEMLTNAVLSKYDWTDADGVHATSSGLNPLLSYYMGSQITKTDEFDKLFMNFVHTPKSCTIRRWSAEYADDISKMEEYETVSSSKTSFFVQADSIYEITATWEQGTVTYLIQVL